MIAAAPMGVLAGAATLGLVAADAAFFAVFGVFVVAFVVLAVITVRWAVRRDRAGRAAWLDRRRAAATEGGADAAPSRANGHVPRRHGQRGGSPRRPG